MAEVTKIKNGVLLECDCGLNHKIIKQGEEIKIKTTYSKKEEIKKVEGEENKKVEENNNEEADIF